VASPEDLASAARRIAAVFHSGDGDDRVARQVHAQALTQLAVHALRAGVDPKYASALLDRALEVEPRFARAWVNRGVVASRRGDLDEAVRATARAIELEPNHLRARINLSRYYLVLGKPEAAQLHARRATVLAPESASAWALAAASARALGQPEWSELAEKAKRLDPKNRDVRNLNR
jgi:Tfp pilus assembly protein PilF